MGDIEQQGIPDDLSSTETQVDNQAQATTDIKTKRKSMPDKQRLKQVAEYHGLRLVAYMAIFAALDAWVLASDLLIANVLSVIAALIVANYLAGIFHEWGHFCGARLAKSRSPIVPKPSGTFVFGFNMEKNTSKQFLAMSLGGPIANWLLVALVFILIPIDNAGRAALFAMVFGRAVGVIIFEGPIIARTMNGGLPQQELDNQLDNGSLDRSQVLGYVTAAAIWLLAV
jgi:hypothetical protein